MAKVKTFLLDPMWGVPDVAIANFITECEVQHYVTISTQFISFPTARVMVIVTKLDTKDVNEDFES